MKTPSWSRPRPGEMIIPCLHTQGRKSAAAQCATRCRIVPRLLVIINDGVNGHSSSSSARSLSTLLLIFLSFSLRAPLCFCRHRFTSVVLAVLTMIPCFNQFFLFHFMGQTTSGRDNKAPLHHESSTVINHPHCRQQKLQNMLNLSNVYTSFRS